MFRDAQGSVMGGYGPEAWHKDGSFFGGHSATLFKMDPIFQVGPVMYVCMNILKVNKELNTVKP